MFNKYLPFLLLLTLFGCKKSNEAPRREDPLLADPDMVYFDLSGKSVGMGQSLSLDLDENKKADLTFYTEIHSIDLNTKLARIYMVISGVACNLAVNINNETTPDLLKGSYISKVDLPVYEWHPALGLTLMRHISTGTQTYWEGSWKDRDHRYLPFEMIIAGETHLGWVELFADTKTDKLIFYRAAVSKQPQTRIRAGH